MVLVRARDEARETATRARHAAEVAYATDGSAKLHGEYFGEPLRRVEAAARAAESAVLAHERSSGVAEAASAVEAAEDARQLQRARAEVAAVMDAPRTARFRNKTTLLLLQCSVRVKSTRACNAPLYSIRGQHPSRSE